MYTKRTVEQTKKLIVLGITLTIIMCAGTVLAGSDQSSVNQSPAMFSTLSQISTEVTPGFTPMTGEELASIEGKACAAGGFNFASCNPTQLNIGIGIIGPQLNICTICGVGVGQSNTGFIFQTMVNGN